MNVSLGISALAMLTSLGAPQQEAQAILATAADQQAARWDTVRNYTVEQRFEGAPMSVPMYYEKTEVDGRTTIRLVAVAEWAEDPDSPGSDPAFWETYAWGLGQITEAHRAEGHPMTPLIEDMTDDMSSFALAIAEAKRTGAGKEGIDDVANVGGMALFAKHARLVGTEVVGDREAFLLEADDLADVTRRELEGGAKFALDRMQVWIDAEEYVPLRVQMLGVYEADGKRSPLNFEILDQDYAYAGSLYLPQRRMTRITGLLEAMETDPKRKKEMEELRKELAKAKEQMAEMEKQLAEVPASARGMVEGQVEKAKKQIEMMEEGGVIESVVQMKVIEINQGPPIDFQPSL